MRKTELTIDVPSLLLKHEVSDQLISEFHAFVGRDAKSKYIFLSRGESIAIEGEAAVYKEQLPSDVTLIYLKIENENIFVETKCRTTFKNFLEINDRSLNQIIIHGPNPVSVRGLGLRVEQLLKPNKLIIRSAFYRFPLSWLWLTLLLIWFAEYRVASLFVPSMNIKAPLSAVGAIILFAISFGTVVVYTNLVLPFFTYWFPYFEIEGNVSTHRLSFQKCVAAIWLSLLCTGLVNSFHLLHK